MDIHSHLRVLWRRRVLVGLGLLISIAAAAKVAGERGDTFAVAQARVLVDTPRSQLIDAHPALVETMPGRAGVLAKLLETGSGRQLLADRIGIAVSELAVVDSQLLVPTVPASLPRAAAEAAARVTEPYVLTVRTDAFVPLISIKTQAPEPNAAAALARAAVDFLRASAPTAEASGTAKFAVQPVAPVKARVLGSGGSSKMAAAAALVLFGLWCAVLGLVPSRGHWRRSVGAGSPRPAG